MKKSSPCFSLLIAIAAIRVAVGQDAPAPIAPQPQSVVQPVAAAGAGMPSGDDLLTRAASQLERRASIATHLRHQVAVEGQQFFGAGTYLQQGSGDELKVRLELEMVGSNAKLLQVCNSRFLWIDRQLPNGRNVTRYDLRQLRADPALAPPEFDKLDGGKANWSPAQPLMLAHSGGLPSLLGSLGENFNFLPPQPMRLAMEPPVSTKPINVPVGPATLGRIINVVGDPVDERERDALANPVDLDERGVRFGKRDHARGNGKAHVSDSPFSAR